MRRSNTYLGYGLAVGSITILTDSIVGDRFLAPFTRELGWA